MDPISEKQKSKILIIEDTRFNVLILTKLLEKDYELSTAENGIEGLALAKSINPDLILLDIIMPEMDGYEVCTRLKRDTDTKDIPVIFLTALDGSVDEEKGLLLGAIDYITKPFRESIIKVRVNNQIELKK